LRLSLVLRNQSAITATFPLMEQLRFSNGTQVDVNSWVGVQGGLALEWRLTEKMGAGDRLSYWTHFFSEIARKICETYGVSVDTFRDEFKFFIERIIGSIDELKWLASEGEHHDIGLLETRALIKFEVLKTSDGRIELDMIFPSIDGKGPLAKESVFFPVTLSA
jgi:hypothetical protein